MYLFLSAFVCIVYVCVCVYPLSSSVNECHFKLHSANGSRTHLTLVSQQLLHAWMIKHQAGIHLTVFEGPSEV